MIFSEALYYPGTDIRDQGWLNSAALYWDTIQTIVPAPMDLPYSSEAVRAFAAEGIVRPLYIQPDTPEVVQTSVDLLGFLHTPEGERVLAESGHIRSAATYARRMGPELYDRVSSSILAAARGGVPEVAPGVINFYLTTLAGILSWNRRVALVDARGNYEPLANRVRRGIPSDVPSSSDPEQEIGEGLLADLKLRVLSISPETPVSKIVAFRNARRSELLFFRHAISDLAAKLDHEAQSLAAFKKYVRGLDTRGFELARDGLQAALNDHGIESYLSRLQTIVFCSSLRFPPAKEGQPMLGSWVQPLAVIIGGVMSVALDRAPYSLERKQALENNPYSYIFGAEAATEGE